MQQRKSNFFLCTTIIINVLRIKGLLVSLMKRELAHRTNFPFYSLFKFPRWFYIMFFFFFLFPATIGFKDMV